MLTDEQRLNAVCDVVVGDLLLVIQGIHADFEAIP